MDGRVQRGTVIHAHVITALCHCFDQDHYQCFDHCILLVDRPIHWWTHRREGCEKYVRSNTSQTISISSPSAASWAGTTLVILLSVRVRCGSGATLSVRCNAPGEALSVTASVVGQQTAVLAAGNPVTVEHDVIITVKAISSQDASSRAVS